MNCPKCGKKVNSNDQFCSGCGQKVKHKKNIKNNSIFNTILDTKVLVTLLIVVLILSGFYYGKNFLSDRDNNEENPVINTSSCGDGICSDGENRCTCSKDCGTCSGDAPGVCQEYMCFDNECKTRDKVLCCGNNICEPDERQNCQSDCENVVSHTDEVLLKSSERIDDKRIKLIFENGFTKTSYVKSTISITYSDKTKQVIEDRNVMSINALSEKEFVYTLEKDLPIIGADLFSTYGEWEDSREWVINEKLDIY